MRQPLNRRRTETLDYIQAMLGQLRTMADAESRYMLAYLIEMAYIEANDILQCEGSLRIAEDQRDCAAAVTLQATSKIKLQ